MKRQMLFFFVLSLCLSYVNAQPEPKVPNCDPIVVTDNFPFYESFEGEDLGCWISTDSSAWHLDTLPFLSDELDLGTQIISFWGRYLGDPVKLISPVFDVTALVYAQIAFYVTKDSWDGD